MAENNGLIGRLGASIFAFSSMYGCSFPSLLSIGNNEHRDLSNSRYAIYIKDVADELSKSEGGKDLITAAELYGSIGELEKMDGAVIEYLRKDPRVALKSLSQFEEIHVFYENKEKEETQVVKKEQ